MNKLFEQINTEKRTTLVLSDYIKIKHGFAFKGEYFSAQPTSDVLVTPGNFAIGGGFKADKFKYYKGSVPDDYILKENDLVVTMTDLSVDADTLGYSALIPHENKIRFLHNQRVGLIQKKKEGIDFKYLYYLMRTRPYQKYVVTTASGSTVKHTSPDRIASYEYDFPSLPTQKKIAEILSAYDSKIENNNKIIKNLEVIARTIFNEWFINFRFPGYEKEKMVDSEMGEIPEGWNAFKLRDLFTFIKGKKPAEVSENQKEGFLQQILIDSFENGKKLYADKQGMVVASDEDLLMVMDGASSGRIEFGIKGIVGSTMSKLQLNKPVRSILYFYLKSKEKDIKDNTSGSAIPHTDKEKVYGYEIALPRDTEYFERILLSFIKGVEKLNHENLSLKLQRDQLLTKLI